jgi:glycosyltransferase involved in cell wall biosynthesis
VRSTGYLSGAALQDSLAWAKAVAMPSKWYENAPISLLESSAYGKPVIGAHISGIPEIIDDGGNGFLFEPGNVAELTLKIQCLTGMRDDALKAMGVAAREKVEREFSLGRHYTGLLEIYSNVLGKPCA